MLFYAVITFIKVFSVRLVIYCLFPLLLCSCVTTTLDPIDDGHYVLSPQTGFILLPVFNDIRIYQLNISGHKNFKLNGKLFNSKKSYTLLELPVGEYRFSSIRIKSYETITDFESGFWDFTVEEGVVNYVGHLIINNHSTNWHRYSLTYELQNNAPIALEYLEAEYPNILKNHLIAFGGVGQDDFFSYAESLSSHKGDK